jgi:hypothetical protein
VTVLYLVQAVCLCGCIYNPLLLSLDAALASTALRCVSGDVFHSK